MASAQRSMSLNRARASPQIDRFLDAPGDLLHGLEIALRGDREARLDDVDAHLVEQLGDFELLLEGHGGAGDCSPSRKVVSKMTTRSRSRAGCRLRGVILVGLHRSRP